MLSLEQRSVMPGSRQASVLGVGTAFVVFISVVIAIRIYVRRVMLHAMGTDDVLMAIGTIFAFGLTAASIAAAYYGVGRHYNDIPDADYVPMLQSIYATRLLYVVALMFVKVSLLLFYLRLDPRRYMRWAVYAIFFIVMGVSIASFFILAFSCFPPAKFWDVTGTAAGHCMNPTSQQSFYEANGILNIITDTLIYLVPIPMLWKVRISARRKGALFGVFGLGILSIAAGGVRYDFVRKLANNPDQYYYLADSLNWCSIEIYVAIFCGSAPSLSVLVKTYAPALLGSSARSRTPNSYPHAQGQTNPSAQGPSQQLSFGFGGKRRRSAGVSMNLGRGMTTNIGSEDEIALSPRGEGILMKTDIRMEVEDRDSSRDTDTGADQFRFHR
ncbi:hypothetical protein BDW74DRAFT_156227 [Aspergillus multicolor]|uniref:uncharacterized protein n=1 Tax=Aspergillus multicolor TaxID=41759 RepID=UPI003CCCE02D